MDEDRLRILLQRIRDAAEYATSAGTNADDTWLVDAGFVERIFRQLDAMHGGPRTDFSPLAKVAPPPYYLALTDKGEGILAAT